MDPGGRQRVVLPVHYPGRVQRYPTRTSLDPDGNPITVLEQQQQPDSQGLYHPPHPPYHHHHHHHHLHPHHCGLEQHRPLVAYKRPKLHSRNFSRGGATASTCFSQYETMYQHYYFQGLSFPQQQPDQGSLSPAVVAAATAGGSYKGHHQQQQWQLTPPAVATAAATANHKGQQWQLPPPVVAAATGGGNYKGHHHQWQLPPSVAAATTAAGGSSHKGHQQQWQLTPPVVAGNYKGHHSRAFQQGLLFPNIMHMAPTTSSASSGCYHGYLADCPGSDSSSSSSCGGSSSARCHCSSSSDSVLDCTEVSNQGVYGSCSTFRSSLSSDYDPYVYRSRSPCRGSTGAEVTGGVAAEAATATADSSSSFVALPGHDCLQIPPSGYNSGYNSGDHLSSCSLEQHHSSRSSLEARDNLSKASTTSDDHQGGQEDPGVSSCSCCFEVLPPSTVDLDPEATCPQSSSGCFHRLLDYQNSTAKGYICPPEQVAYEGLPPLTVDSCKDSDPDPAKPQSSSSGGCFHRLLDFQNSAPNSYLCPPVEQVSYEGLPCCFYKEVKVHRGSGGCYADDYAVSIQYADSADAYCSPSSSGQGCCEQLAQRIPIIPGDTDCLSGAARVETEEKQSDSLAVNMVALETGGEEQQQQQDAGDRYYSLSGGEILEVTQEEQEKEQQQHLDHRGSCGFVNSCRLVSTDLASQ